jgi:hypothetical protein
VSLAAAILDGKRAPGIDALRHTDTADVLLRSVHFLPAGGEVTIPSSRLTPGTHLFFCAIHPWMHETVVVR